MLLAIALPTAGTPAVPVVTTGENRIYPTDPRVPSTEIDNVLLESTPLVSILVGAHTVEATTPETETIFYGENEI